MMKRNKFGLSHYKLATFNMGKLVPLTWFEVIPGDSIQQITSALIRVQPLNAPVMHPVRCRIHHWLIPLSQIWDDYEDFFTGGEDGLQTPTHPYLDLGTVNEGDLLDYLGIPPAAYGGGGNMEVSALPLRAYQLVWREMYRDQQLVTAPTIDTTSGADSTTTTTLQSVAWEKDYFTTCREEETLGADINIPLLGSADVEAAGTRIPKFDFGDDGTSRNLYVGGTSQDVLVDSAVGAGGRDGYWESPELQADLTSATGASINDIRLSLALQRFQEARQQYGARYPEYLRYLGITPDDQSLHRPVYLGGGRQTIAFSEIVSSADTGSYSVGDLVGHGIGAMRTRKYRKFIGEHGIIISLMSVLPKTMYANGIQRQWLRTVKEEYFQRELQHLGEQIVYNKETYSEHSSPDGTFGYIPRYDEYRGLPSSISGEFRSTLDHFHYGRIFTGDTALNSSFIQAVPTTRVYQSTSTDQLWVMANHSIQARRPIIKRGRPMTF